MGATPTAATAAAAPASFLDRILPARVTRLASNSKLRRALRAGRIVAISVSLFTSGVAYGQISVAQDPEEFDRRAMRQCLLSQNVKSYCTAGEREQLVSSFFHTARPASAAVLSSNTLSYDKHTSIPQSHPMWQATLHAQRVFHRVRVSALEVAEARVALLKHKLGKRPGAPTGAAGDIPWKDLKIETHMLEDEEDLEHWKAVVRMLKCDWRIVMTDQLVPNAFVSPTMPHRVFINVGLFDHFANNDDEAAVILGHELSHAILGHSEQAMILDVVQSVAIAVLVSMLDFTGTFGFFVEAGLVGTSALKYIPSMFSREHEREADELGTLIATRACYDPDAEAVCWHKMANFEHTVVSGGRVKRLTDSHPMSEERVENHNKRMGMLKQQFAKCNCASKRLQQKSWAPITGASVLQGA